MSRVLTCVDYDETTETCVVEAWVETPMQLFPELSVSDSAALGVALFGLFTLAFIFRVLFREARST